MKHFLFTVVIALLVVVPAQAADVGVSVSVGQPGFYGRIDIGNFPQPELIYPQPVVIRPVSPGVVVHPVYMHVPPGHERNWSKHCSKYNACGRPVYFVRDRWYNEVYVPQHQARYGKDHNGKQGRGGHEKGNHGHGRGHD